MDANRPHGATREHHHGIQQHHHHQCRHHSHALLLAKIGTDLQPQALSACFKEVYNGGSQKPARILLPVRNLQSWIESNVLLVLKDAPYDKRDAQPVPTAGSCAECPKREGHNKLLFADDLGGQGDR